jgi:hypothetical protein
MAAIAAEMSRPARWAPKPAVQKSFCMSTISRPVCSAANRLAESRSISGSNPDAREADVI